MSDHGTHSASTLSERTWPFTALSRDGRRRWGLVSRAAAVLLLAGLLFLTPFAFASQADPGYIAALYDESDFDDANTLVHKILAFTGDNGASDASPDWKVTPTLLVVGITARLRNVRLPLALIGMTCCRAPPAGHHDGCPRAPSYQRLPRSPSAAIFRSLASVRRSCWVPNSCPFLLTEGPKPSAAVFWAREADGDDLHPRRLFLAVASNRVTAIPDATHRCAYSSWGGRRSSVRADVTFTGAEWARGVAPLGSHGHGLDVDYPRHVPLDSRSIPAPALGMPGRFARGTIFALH